MRDEMFRKNFACRQQVTSTFTSFHDGAYNWPFQVRAPCSQANSYQSFVTTRCLQFLLWRWRQCVPPKCQNTKRPNPDRQISTCVDIKKGTTNSIFNTVHHSSAKRPPWSGYLWRLPSFYRVISLHCEFHNLRKEGSVTGTL